MDFTVSFFYLFTLKIELCLNTLKFMFAFTRNVPPFLFSIFIFQEADGEAAKVLIQHF